LLKKIKLEVIDLLADYIDINDEVRNALEEKKPIVSLESTIIAHGMPFPQNIETAKEVELIIRKTGAVPATIAIINGRIKCGLTEAEIQLLACEKGVQKAGERELAYMVSTNANAATTVSASLAVSNTFQIQVFVTGGIGAVGPEAGKTYDISADLQAIVRNSCLVVCAGAKAFMDIPATLEYFETFGVPVGVYQAANFPFFYSRDSGVRVDWSPNNIEEIAKVFRTHLNMKIGTGMLIGVPVPEGFDLPAQDTRNAIDTAMKAIGASGKTGKEVTPFLLETIKNETDGKSLEANVALIKNNAKVGAELAMALSKFDN
jgi:pseudouridylate synthase